jgi:hypothetical protein
MFFQTLAIALAISITTSSNATASNVNNGSVAASSSVETAVNDFNRSNKEIANWAGQQPLTEQEFFAALVHETKTLSADTQQIAKQIIQTRALPSGVELKAYRRHFADRHATYLYQIKLSFDKGPVLDESGRVLEGRRRAESLTIRKRYLATQPQRRGQELKTLDELLSENDG